jgi:two-component system sensor histidine kinase/response regulator
MEKKKILVVDDERDLLLILKKGLSAEGYSVITADNGHDGIASAKTKHPDLMILDRVLGDIQGEEVATRLRKDPITKNIPVIFLSALLSAPNNAERFTILDNSELLIKPYNFEDLIEAIQKHLQPKCIT